MSVKILGKYLPCFSVYSHHIISLRPITIDFKIKAYSDIIPIIKSSGFHNVKRQTVSGRSPNFAANWFKNSNIFVFKINNLMSGNG